MIGQSYNTARHCTDDPDAQKQIVDESMRRCLALGPKALEITPGELSQLSFEAAREISGVEDPYIEDKRSSNAAALAFYPELKERLAASPDPLPDALLLAMAGNIIDLGIDQEYDLVDDVVNQVERGFNVEELDKFRADLADAKSILYLADNSGEIVFDRLLIEVLGPDRITLMVKAGPIVNDAMRADAEQVGLADQVRVVDTGSNYFGFPWQIVSEEAREEFRRADLVISKGHANFETVSELGADWDSVWYLLKAKCDEVARIVGATLGDVVLISHATVKALEAQTACK